MPDQLDRIGQRLGNYQLIRLLGQGGFAEATPHHPSHGRAAMKAPTTQHHPPTPLQTR